MFRKSPNVLDPYFWRDVAMALPDYGERLAKLAQDWIEYARVQGGPARITSAAVALAGLLIFAIGFIRWWRRQAFIARIGDRYGMALASLAVFLRRALTAPIVVFVVLQLLEQFQLIPDGYERLVSGLIFGTAMAALARAAATSVLAPDDARRRQVKFDDTSAQWLSTHLVWGGRLFGAFLILRAVHRTIGAPDAVDTALRMLFALSIAGLLVHLLVRERDVEEEPRRIPGMRLLAWIVVARHRGLAARRLRAVRRVRRRPRGVHPFAGRDALSAADRHRRCDQPDHVGRLLGRSKVCAPARDRSAPARPVRQD